MTATKKMIESYRRCVEEYLKNYYARFHDEPQRILFEAMEYSLLAGGKRLRSTLVLEFCRLCGGEWKKAVPFGAAIEMIHTYSLIHDDLPCMDNDDYRRGKLTNHKVYGEAMAILAGDALLTAAFKQISSAELCADAKVAAVNVLSDCAGELGMVGGQVLDIQSEQRTCTPQEVYDIQSRKTGALIRAACVLGVIAGQGSEDQISAAIDFADNLGLAFQIRDDMLDVIGDKNELGKATGVDATKNTFVRIYGLEACDDLVKEHTEKALGSLNHFNDNDFMIKLSNQLIGRRT